MPLFSLFGEAVFQREQIRILCAVKDVAVKGTQDGEILNFVSRETGGRSEYCGARLGDW